MSEKILDRKLRVDSKQIGEIDYDFPEKIEFANGGELYVYRDNDSEVLKMEFQFDAGSAHSTKRLVAGFTNRLIASGTSEMTEKQISEKLDFYGAFFEEHVGNDEASFSVYTLKKYSLDVLKLVSDVLNDPIFPEHEVATHRNIRKQKFLVSSEKVGFLAKQEFANAIFGENHIYGGKTMLNDFDVLQREDLLNFHARCYKHQPLIMLAGNVSDELIKEIERLFSGNVSESSSDSYYVGPTTAKGRINLEKKDAVQSAIRIGRIMFNRNHPDFPEMQVLNTVFGGYFGSRLMDNLREDKGFTYGVGSGVASMLKEGYFFISTEVGADTTEFAVQEIHYEMKRIREELIPEEELDLVKNYLLGQILKSTDGVFARMNRFKTLHLFGQNESDFQNMILGIRNASASRMQELANHWFTEEEMTTVVAGKTGG